MTSFDERKKAYENKFAHEEEIKFKIASRRRKLLGLWAAELMGMSDEESLNYAKDMISFGIEDNTPGAVIKKIMNDMKERSIKISEAAIRSKNSELELIAAKQIQGK